MNNDERPGSLDRRRFLQVMGLGAAGAALGACAGSSGSGGGGTTGSSSPPSSSFPIGAAASASSKPVTVTMWHSMTENNLKTLTTLQNQFNNSQSDVKVTLVNQSSYSDTLTAYTAALGTPANLPDLVQIQSTNLQTMIDSQSIVPAGDAVAADHYSTADLLPSTLSFFTVDSRLWAMPWNESSQVLYYDKKAFERAGLDPDKPPATLADYKSYSHTIVAKGIAKYGTSLKLTASNFEDWVAQSNGLLVNNNNGRTGQRATAVEFDGTIGIGIFSWFSDMLRSRLAQATPGVGSGGFDNLLAIGSGTAPMSIDTSAALGTILVVLETAYKNVELGVGPLPSPAATSEGVPYGGAGLFIVKDSPAERQDGAWQFIKFLLQPEQMATWSLGSGYIPINKASVSLPSVQQAWAKTPQYRVAYEQVLNTKPSDATAGAVLGAFTQVETIITNGLTAVSNGTSASSALSAAASASNAAITSYNQRV